MNTYKIALADDHVLLRQGIRKIIEDRYQVVGEAGDGIELLTLLKTVSPDMVILDISMPKLRGIELLSEIKASYPEIRVMILTMHCEMEYFRTCMAAGADGYLLKEDADTELFTAIERVRQGKIYVSPNLGEDLVREWTRTLQKDYVSSFVPEVLSSRERQVLKLVAEGKTSKEVAELLFISTRTVEHHRASIMNKLKVRKTAELVKYAMKNNYV